MWLVWLGRSRYGFIGSSLAGSLSGYGWLDPGLMLHFDINLVLVWSQPHPSSILFSSYFPTLMLASLICGVTRWLVRSGWNGIHLLGQDSGWFHPGLYLVEFHRHPPLLFNLCYFLRTPSPIPSFHAPFLFHCSSHIDTLIYTDNHVTHTDEILHFYLLVTPPKSQSAVKLSVDQMKELAHNGVEIKVVVTGGDDGRENSQSVS